MESKHTQTLTVLIQSCNKVSRSLSQNKPRHDNKPRSLIQRECEVVREIFNWHSYVRTGFPATTVLYSLKSLYKNIWPDNASIHQFSN